MGVVEFGRTFDIAKATTDTADFERMTMDEIVRDYQRAKIESFPTWDGFPEIKTQRTLDGNLQVAWYVAVPKECLFTPEDEQLWQS